MVGWNAKVKTPASLPSPKKPKKTHNPLDIHPAHDVDLSTWLIISVGRVRYSYLLYTQRNGIFGMNSSLHPQQGQNYRFPTRNCHRPVPKSSKITSRFIYLWQNLAFFIWNWSENSLRRPTEEWIQSNSCLRRPTEGWIQSNSCLRRPTEGWIQPNSCLRRPTEGWIRSNSAFRRATEARRRFMREFIAKTSFIINPNYKEIYP